MLALLGDLSSNQGPFWFFGFPSRMAVASQDTHSTAELRFALLTVAKTWDPTVMAAAVVFLCV